MSSTFTTFAEFVFVDAIAAVDVGGSVLMMLQCNNIKFRTFLAMLDATVTAVVAVAVVAVVGTSVNVVAVALFLC